MFSIRTPPSPLRLCVPPPKKTPACQRPCVEIPTTTHVFLTRMTRKSRNYHPAHFDRADYRYAMGGWNGNLPSFSLFLPFSLSPQAVGPLILFSPLHLRCATPTSLRLCVQKNTCVQKACVEILTSSHFFLTRITRIFRNCHPAHFDRADHRDAMGGWYGSCHPCLLLAFPEGDKRLIGHGWHAWRPKGAMTCLPCLRPCRMDELCRSSTVPQPTTYRADSKPQAVELLQSSYTFGTTVRQGSRFAPTLPYQAFNPFGVGELRGDGWQFRKIRVIRVKK